MNTSTPHRTPPPVIFSPDGQNLTWSPRTSAGQPITKIVVGEPPTRGEASKGSLTLLGGLPADFAERFPALTHLHLWGIGNLTEIPPLPPALRCLDLRACPHLTALPPLPSSLDTLVLESCSALRVERSSPSPSLRELRDLSIRECPEIAQQWLQDVLDQASHLVTLDASGCTKLKRIERWPPSSTLDDVRLDGCTGLGVLPAEWPPSLRRIGLRGASSITDLPPLTAALDYVDLAGTESLRRLDIGSGAPWTLFLHRSGALVPPATFHGSGPDENVANDVRGYFSDVQLTGPGRITRCKLLMLGNGGAGKTSLSLALIGDDPQCAEDLGTTHGVQFWDLPIEVTVGNAKSPIHLHVWDFGGQDIYHGTHRLFMSTGAVFILLWHAEQDGRQPEPNSLGYQDEWRLPKYWMEFIRFATGGRRPHVAVVCSHQGVRDPALLATLKAHLLSVPESEHPACFFIDSSGGKGELDALRHRWLPAAVGKEIETQGAEVSLYLQIVQELVEEWLDTMTFDPAFRAAHNQMQPERFRQAVINRIEEALADENETRCETLRRSIRDGSFVINDDRLVRTLRFLSRSGWVYWGEDLFERRVIVGQQWALDGIYAVLDRRAESTIFTPLLERQGRFTQGWLGQNAKHQEQCWNDLYSIDEQRLLISYMADCGLCFELRAQPEQQRHGEPLYVSVEHLPDATAPSMRPTFTAALAGASVTSIDATDGLIRHEWFLLLQAVGTEFGESATYSRDTVQMGSTQGEVIRITRRESDPGLSGRFEVRVAGPDAAERQKQVAEHVRHILKRARSDSGSHSGGESGGFRREPADLRQGHRAR